MAERQNNAHSSKRPVSSSMKKGTYIKDNTKKSSSKDLLSREEEYKRLNEELEAKTATLIQEADEVMRGQDSVLSRTSLLDNINAEDFLKDLDGPEDELADENINVTDRPSHARATSKASNQSRPPSQPTSSRPQSTSQSRRTNRSGKSRSNVADDVAVPDEAFMTDLKGFSLQNTIASIEDRTDADHTASHLDEEDVMPTAAAEMGSEAQIRFLKAKLRVMQEELDRLAQECHKKDEENTGLMSRIKDVEDERNRLTRSNASQQSQIDKYKKLAEDGKNKADGLETQLTGLRKELDGIKRSQKQQVSSHSATEVRLNRALEDVEKYKMQLQQAKSHSKDSSDQEKRKVESLLAENKRLEKQKNELMTGFKKQLKLIDILKRQKMHIEAAKMLSFTEEEFVKALEWGN